MKIVRKATAALVVLSLGSSAALPRLAAPGHPGHEAPPPALAQGLEAGLQAYARAAEAYAGQPVHMPAVALWAVALAALVVLLEWVLGRGRGDS